MTHPTQPPFNPRVASVALWVVFATTVFYAIVGLVLTVGGVIPESGLSGMPPETIPIFTAAIVVSGALTAIASFPLRRLLLQRRGPAVGSVSYRVDMPPSPPHNGVPTPHSHEHRVNQSPPDKGCKCFWNKTGRTLPGVRQPPLPNGQPGGGGIE